MKSLLACALAASLAIALAGPALALDRTALAVARRDLQSAVNKGDLTALMSLRARFAAMSQADPGNALLRYWVAVASWRAMPLQKNNELAQRIGDDALDHLEKGLTSEPKFAEALALRGGIQGMLIGYRPSSAMTLGPQSGANISRAISMEPGNPRIHLLAGVGELHKPAVFGGGPKGAIEEFRRAQELFAKEAVTDSIAPDWGRDDAFLWEGRAAMKLKDYAGARVAYRRALEANPANGWIRTQLLPAAEQALAAKEK
ncbi:MAG: tetratricopeptide repeat protein [Candidatus Eisenbacteria bacterium]